MEPYSKRHLHLELARLALGDETQRQKIYQRLLSCDPTEFLVLRGALYPPDSQNIESLWKIVCSPSEGVTQHLRAAGALARYDPTNSRWNLIISAVVNDLVHIADFNEMPTWIEAFEPIKGQLIPPLTVAYRDANRTDLERMYSAQILVKYFEDKPEKLAELLMASNERQFLIVFPRVKLEADKTSALLLSELNIPLPSDANDAAEEDSARRQANSAIALFLMDKSKRVWQLLSSSSHPTVRSFLIQRLGVLGVNPEAIVERLNKETDVATRRALILSLGQCPAIEGNPKEAVVNQLLDLYRDAEDPGLHGASEWLLRHWGQDSLITSSTVRSVGKESENIERIRQRFSAATAPSHPSDDAMWYVNCQGQTMVVLRGPIKMRLGSPATESGHELGVGNIETLHDKTIPRNFAVSDKAVTVEQFRRFDNAVKYNRVYAPHDDCPINGVSWYQAAEYCNWLSGQEGLEPIYEIEWRENQPEPEMRLKSDYLKMNGYRLPTEAEWECACRADTSTSHYFGAGEELLGRYAWYTKDSQDRWTLEVGTLKPNELGLFDMIGNAWQWCEDKGDEYLSDVDSENVQDMNLVTNNDYRMVRGGSFTYPAWNDRSASRGRYPPKTQNNNITFRVARTFN